MNNKILKVLTAAVVAASMTVSGLPVFAGAGSAAEKENIFADNFDGYNAISDMSPYWYVDGNTNGCGIETIGGHKAMSVSYSDGAAPILAMAKNTLTESISEGRVRISFDIYLENTSDEIWSFLDYVGSADQADYGANQIITIHKPEGGSAYIEGTEVDTAKWYNVVLNCNLGVSSNYSYDIGVYDAGGNIVGSTGKTESPLMETFNNINFTAWRSGKIYVDNLEITAENESKEYPVTLSLKHNGIYDRMVLFDENRVWFEVTASEPKKSYADLTISYKLRDESGNVVSEESRLHPVNAADAAVERFLVTNLSRGKYKLEITASAGGAETASITKNIYAAQITSADEAKNTRTGVTTHASHGYDTDMILNYAGAAGFGWVRDSASWKNCETAKGVINIPQDFISFVDRANAEGMNILATLSFGNPLYSNSETDMPVSGEYRNAYINYVKAVVNRFKGKITAYEVWNEPNEEMFNTTGATAEEYAGLLKEVYNTVKAIDPDALVVGVSLSGTDMTYTDTLLREGAAAYMDVFSIHPYNKMYLPEERLTYDTNKVRVRLDAIGYGSMPVWVTEHGYYTSGDDYALTENMQAAYMVRSSVLYDAWCKSGNTDGKYMWYDLQNNGTDASDKEDNFGLIDYSLNPKPSYAAAAAYNRLTAGLVLDTMDAVEDIGVSHTVNSGSYNALYTDSTGRRVNVLWNARTTGSVELNVSGEQAIVYNMYGDVIDTYELEGSSAGIMVNTSTEPVYVVSGVIPEKVSDEAAEITNVTVYVNGNDVYLRGSVNGSKPVKKVSVIVMPEGESFDSFADSALQEGYVDQITTTDGSFAFDFELPGENKRYTIQINGTGITSPYVTGVTVGKTVVAQVYVEKNSSRVFAASELKSGDEISLCTDAAYGTEGVVVSKIEYASGSYEIIVCGRITGDNGSLKTSFTIPAGETVTGTDMMFWDSLEGMKPVNDKYELK